MTELENQLFIEKFRPSTLDDLILENKDKIKKYLESPKSLPSFIFYSDSPGTGKTSLAKIIIKILDCDSIVINSSSERGIDTIREQVTRFAMGLSSNDSKRCVFLDEGDGLTTQAQNSLRNLMETYSSNCFFIFSCNDVNKIIKPIRSRCQEISFENPNIGEIELRLSIVIEKEGIIIPYSGFIQELLDKYYPDIRSMVKTLQELKLTGKNPLNVKEDFEMFLDAVERKDIDYVIQATYSSKFDIMGWIRWYFKKVFDSAESIGLEKCVSISELLADTESNWNQGSNLQIIFLANIFKLMRIL